MFTSSWYLAELLSKLFAWLSQVRLKWNIQESSFMRLILMICNWNTTISSMSDDFMHTQCWSLQQQQQQKAEYHWIKLIFEKRNFLLLLPVRLWKCLVLRRVCFMPHFNELFFTTSNSKSALNEGFVSICLRPLIKMSSWRSWKKNQAKKWSVLFVLKRFLCVAVKVVSWFHNWLRDAIIFRSFSAKATFLVFLSVFTC